MPICSKCFQAKLIDDFSWRNKKNNTRQSICRNCRSLLDKESSQKDRIKYLARKRADKLRVLERNQTFILEYLTTHSCVDCGENDPLYLEFDHLRDKAYSVSSLIGWGSLETLVSEISKCEVRCVKCHRRKTAHQYKWYKIRNVG